MANHQRDSPTPIDRIKDLIGPRPALLRWVRPAWECHRIGYILAPGPRNEMFAENFRDNLKDFRVSLREHPSAMVRMILLARFFVWTWCLAKQCWTEGYGRRG